jgi:hypothetical protein
MTISVSITETTITAAVTEQVVATATLTQSPITAAVSGDTISAAVTSAPVSVAVAQQGISAAVTSAPISVAVSSGLSDAPADGSTYGRKDGGWVAVTVTETDPVFAASVAAGIVAGDITNWNTAYGWGNHATAGYQSALTFPLSPTLGGTGVNNGTNLLTVPATGTAALLATANVFTVGQVIDGTADEIQLRVQAHSTQAGNIQTWESSTGTRLASMNSFGFGVGADAIAARTVNIAKTWTDTSGSLFGVYTNTVINPGANNSSATYKNYYSQITLSSVGTGNLTSTSGTTAFSIAANNNKTTGTVASLYAGMLGLSNLQTGTITNSYGEYIDIDNSGLGTMGTTYALRMRVRNTGGGTMNSVYGLYVDDINTASGNNYAIYTNAGLARFGGIVNTTESYQVDGTQVVSNRVVDARIDDTPNSGDATTDGIIAAIQTALVSHGLMAAA